MSYCRVCLQCKKKLYSLYDSNNYISYFSMLISIANVKINEEHKDMICYKCRTKLNEYYNFKLLIERSDLKLNERLYRFNNLSDIKNEVLKDIEINDSKKKCFDLDYDGIFETEEECFKYNNTLIRRFIKQEQETIPVEFNNESDSYYECDYMELNNRSEDEDKDSITKVKKNKKKLKNKNKCPHTKTNVKKVEQKIKPIIMNDLKLIKTSIKKCQGTKYKYKSKEELCPYCGKTTKSLKTHILTHTGVRQFQCNDCPRKFYKKTDLINHLKTHTKEKVIYKCDMCIARFSNKYSLTSHMKVHGENQETYYCEICEKPFRWKHGLKRHMLIHNLSEKSFKCDLCTMTFDTKYAFKHHYRVHSGERPFKCELCAQPYSYKRDFNRHCLKKHGVVVDRRPVYVMNEEVLKREKALMKNLMLRFHGIPTETEPLDSFQGPQAALALAKALKVMQNCQIPVEVNL